MQLRSVFFTALFLLGTLAASAQAAPNPQRSFSDLTPDQRKSILDEASRRAPIARFGDANTCFTMRSYIFAREAPGSDAMRLVRETTCTPARRFSPWSTDTPASSSAPQPQSVGVHVARPVLLSPQP